MEDSIRDRVRDGRMGGLKLEIFLLFYNFFFFEINIKAMHSMIHQRQRERIVREVVNSYSSEDR